MGSIGSTLNSINSSLLAEIQSFTGAPATTGSAAGTAAASSGNGDQINFSQVSQLFKQLQQLQTSNPSEFKQVLTDAAGKLQTAAGQQTDPNAVAFLNNLAARFETAAETGNLAALHPRSPQDTNGTRGHHRGHHDEGDAENNSSSTNPATSPTTSTAAAGQAALGQATARLLSLLSSLNSQSPQNGLGGAFSGQTGNTTESVLIAILSANSSATQGSNTFQNTSQVQALLASFVTSNGGSASS